jgi:hypothetical protein
MEEKRNFVVFARIDDDGNLDTQPALLTSEQISLLNWLYDKGFLNGTFETDNSVFIEEP